MSPINKPPIPREEPESGVPAPGAPGVRIKDHRVPPSPPLPHFEDAVPPPLPPPPRHPATATTGGTAMIIALTGLISALGSSGFSSMFGPSVSPADLAAVKTEVVHKLDEQTAALKRIEERQKAEAEKLRVAEERIEYLASWVCADNEGKLGPGFDACESRTWEPPPLGHKSPVRRTFGEYPKTKSGE